MLYTSTTITTPPITGPLPVYSRPSDSDVRRVLKHIGLYRVSLACVMEHVCGADAVRGDALQSLVQEERLQQCEALAGGLRYYQLTASAARTEHIPVHRTRPLTERQLREAVAVLWFCCMSGKNRRRIERHQLGSLFGRGKAFGRPHCAEHTEEDVCIYRLYFPHSKSRDDHVLGLLRNDAAEAMAHPLLGPWVVAHTFRFCLLLETTGRFAAMERLLSRSLAKESPLPVRIHFELVPSLEELAAVNRSFSANTRSAAPSCTSATQNNAGRLPSTGGTGIHF